MFGKSGWTQPWACCLETKLGDFDAQKVPWCLCGTFYEISREMKSFTAFIFEARGNMLKLQEMLPSHILVFFAFHVMPGALNAVLCVAPSLGNNQLWQIAAQSNPLWSMEAAKRAPLHFSRHLWR
jgi:hypothetical protein